jgi:hypothetical protein
MVMLATVSGVCYVGGLVGAGFLYHLFAADAQESLNIALITLTLLAAIAYTLLSLHKRVRHLSWKQWDVGVAIHLTRLLLPACSVLRGPGRTAWQLPLSTLSPRLPARVSHCHPPWHTAMERLRIVTLGIPGGESLTGRYATPADFLLHDGTPYRRLRVRRWGLGFVHRSRGHSLSPLCQTFCVPIRNFYTAVRPGR